MNNESSKNIKIIVGIIIGLVFLIIILFLIKGCSREYTVTFDSDGGSSIPSVKVKEGEKVEKPDNPTKEGYLFDNWYLDDTIFDFDTKITKDITLIAKWKVDSIILDNESLNLVIGDEEKIVISLLPDEVKDTDLVYESSDTSIATVSSTGVIKALKDGKVTITIKTKDGKYSTQLEVLVTKEKVKIDSIEITGASSVMVGRSIKLSIKVNPSNATKEKITWKSSDDSIATISENGIVTGLKPGKVTITATTENGVTTTIVITITKRTSNNNSGTTNKPSSNPGSNNKPSTGGNGGEATPGTKPEETDKPSNPGGETTNPENPSGGTSKPEENPSGGGTSKPEENPGGTTKPDNPSTPSNPDTPDEPIKEVTGLKISGDSKVKINSSIKLNLEITPSDAKDKSVTWKSSNEEIATVSENGIVTGLKPGKVVITVTSKNGVTATYEVTVEDYVYELELTKISLEGLSKTYQYYYKVLRDSVEFKDYKGFVLNNQEYRKVASTNPTVAGNDVVSDNKASITLSDGSVKTLKVTTK